jgi:amino acid adenylation domain-containing protein
VSAVELLGRLRALDVRVWLHEDRVRVSAPSGALTPELQQELAARKEELRALLASFRAEAPDARSMSAAPVETAPPGEFPVSFAQRQLWFLDHLDTGNIAYNIGASHLLRGPIDVDAMRRAIDAVVRRQGVLRTAFREQNGEVTQVVLPFEPRRFEVTDISHVPPDERLREFERLRKEEAQRPFDLAKGSLFRASLVKVSTDQHVLLFSLHHIVCDGWSLGIFLQELRIHYEAYRQGRESLIAPLPMQYGQYAQGEQQRLVGPNLERMLNYWRERLRGAPAVLELPTDRPRPPRQTLNGGNLRFALPADLSNSLRTLARREQATLYMTILAVFTALLHRYSAQSDIVVGTPLANRDTPDLEGLIGLFVSTLAIRSELSADPSARELIAQIRENVLEGQANQDLPFEKLVEALRPERTMAWSPIFQVTFVLQNTPLASEFEVATAAAMYDMSLFCWDEPDGLRGSFEYNTDLFDPATIARMSEHFERLARAMVGAPDTPISRLTMLGPEERERVLRQWNSTAIEYERQSSIVELFAQAAAKTPNAIALETADANHEVLPKARFTYAELAQATDRMAAHLRASGVVEGAAVGLYVDRSVAAVMAIIGILKAGGFYVPLDSASPPARIAETLSDADIQVVVTQRSLRSKLPETGITAIAIDTDWQKIEKSSALPHRAEVRPDSLAYVMFTSGTTGKPKGVCVTHRNVARLVRGADYVSVVQNDVVLQFAPLAFDASTFEIWAALLNGARLIVYPHNVPTAGELAAALDKHRVSILWLTSGFFQYMVENELASVARVRQVLAGGDVLSLAHAQKLLEAKRDGALVNGYGPTENTTFTCCHRMEAGERLSGNVPIGRPISNTRVYILDAHGEPTPIGVPGELFAAGDGVACGYLRDPHRTAERFVADPFSTEPGALMYRTGDLARWRSDGVIEFFGRRDRQVKIRGFRIELDEVENALRTCARVHDAVVIAKRDASGTSALVGYLVPRAGTAIDQAEVRRELAQRLPDYMTPSVFVMLSALPLTANGKLDRAALPDPVIQKAGTVPPRTILETQLLTIWEGIFGRGGFGVCDNFFDLGGHSLLAVRMFAQVERVFGRRLPTSALFEAPTIEELAERLETEGFRGPWGSLVAIQSNGTKPPLFLVPGMGGNVVGYMELARLLGPDQPFYGLQARGLDGREKPFERIEPMAEHYVDELRKVQPKGPYYIGGACFGGVVAWEMAQRLRAAGEEVAFLMLLETWPPKRRLPLVGAISRQSQHVRFLASAAFRHFRELTRMSPRKIVQALRERSKIVTEMVASRDLYRGERAAMYVDRVSTANLKAFENYRTRPYDRSAMLVLASARRIREARDPRMLWAALVPSYVKFEIPALDSGLVLKSPHVEVLAQLIREQLQVAHRQYGEPAQEHRTAVHDALSVAAASS